MKEKYIFLLFPLLFFDLFSFFFGSFFSLRRHSRFSSVFRVNYLKYLLQQLIRNRKTVSFLFFLLCCLCGPMTSEPVCSFSLIAFGIEKMSYVMLVILVKRNILNDKHRKLRPPSEKKKTIDHDRFEHRIYL